MMLNDGTKKFHHQTDGRDQQIAGCLKDFRNKPFPVKAKLEYWKNVITVNRLSRAAACGLNDIQEEAAGCFGHFAPTSRSDWIGHSSSTGYRFVCDGIYNSVADYNSTWWVSCVCLCVRPSVCPGANFATG